VEIINLITHCSLASSLYHPTVLNTLKRSEKKKYENYLHVYNGNFSFTSTAVAGVAVAVVAFTAPVGTPGKSAAFK
jgi:hypothetical protein